MTDTITEARVKGKNPCKRVCTPSRLLFYIPPPLSLRTSSLVVFALLLGRSVYLVLLTLSLIIVLVSTQSVRCQVSDSVCPLTSIKNHTKQGSGLFLIKGIKQALVSVCLIRTSVSLFRELNSLRAAYQV